MQQIQLLYIFCYYFMTLQLQQMHSSAIDEFLLLTRKSKNDLRAKTRGSNIHKYEILNKANAQSENFK